MLRLGFPRRDITTFNRIKEVILHLPEFLRNGK